MRQFKDSGPSEGFHVLGCNSEVMHGRELFPRSYFGKQSILL